MTKQLDFRLENLADPRPWLLSLAMVALFVACNYLVMAAPHYETADDPNFAMLVGGFGIVDKPDYHFFFSHFLIGKMLCFLHGLSQKTPWYAIYIVTSQVIAMTVAVRMLMTKCTDKGTAILFALVFLYFGCTRSVDYLQFTTTASLVGIASGLLALAALERPQTKRAAAFCLAGSLALIVLASLIRPWAALLMVIILALALFIRCVQLKDWRRLKAAALVVAISGGIAPFVYFNNEAHYKQSDGWRDWLAMHIAWLPFRDHGAAVTKLSRSACQPVGWTAADMNIFKIWYVLDAKTFSVEKLNEISKSPGDHNPFKNRTYEGKPDIAIGLLVLAIIVVSAFNSKLSWQARTLFLVSIVALAAAILITTRCPVRVYGPILAYTLTILLWYVKPSGLKALVRPSNLLRAACGWALLLGLSIALIVSYRADSALRDAHCRELRSDLIALNPKKDDLYVRWLLSVPINNLRPFEPFYDELINMKTLNIATAGRNPHNLERMRQFGIDDLLGQLDKDHVYLVSQERYNVLLDNYIVSKYGKKPVFQPVCARHPNFTVYKVKFVAPKDFPGTDLSPLCPAPTASDLSLFKDVSLTGLRVQAENDGVKKLKRNQKAEISYKPEHPLELAKFSHFFVELSAGEWLYSRCAQVYVSTADGKRIALPPIYLLPDGKLHRYAITLNGEHKKLKMTELTIVPIWTKYSARSFKLGNLGFLQAGNNSQEALSIAAKGATL